MTTKSLSSSEARASFYSIIKEVVDDVVPVVIRQRGKKSAVIISEDEYNSLIETAFVTAGGNAQRLRESIAQVREGKTRPIFLKEIDDLCK